MNQPKKSHWASLAAALGAAPAENQSEEPSSEAPAPEQTQEVQQPTAEVVDEGEAAETVEISEPVAEAPVLEEPAEEEAPVEEEVAEEPAPPTKRHWAGLAQSLGLPVERLFGNSEPAPQPPAAKKPAPKPAPKPQPAAAIEKELTEKPEPSPAESTARSLFDERDESPESEKRAANLFIQIDSSSKKSSDPAPETRNLIPGDEIFFETGDYDLIEDMTDEPEPVDEDDDHDDEPAPRSRKRKEASDEDESGAPRRRRRRRRGRRRERSETTSEEDGSDEPQGEATEVAAELEPAAKEASSSESGDEEGSESSGAPRRRRRRRRSRKADDGEPRAKSSESAPKRELTDVDFPGDEDASLDDVYDDDDDHDMRRHRNIPSWLDAVTSIVDMNIERHKTAPAHVERRSGGGGGRRRRGGGRRPAAKD
ncbi:hypothetical protein [Blastopirellula retiformator]|uniref:Uncharacterized protein n=1 Tax=Blastopirellula retiformator TaxID=2527970 RepID=A0A5C5V9D1_9BACT|nr:hypothetical protein [Blastopirellula retiformator]TWT34477.1 hypothetical protein Enr8_18860 [Blastopirellula retiformator]